MPGVRFAFEFGWKHFFRFTFELGKVPPSVETARNQNGATSVNKLCEYDNSQVNYDSTPSTTASRTTRAQIDDFNSSPFENLLTDSATASCHSSILQSPLTPQNVAGLDKAVNPGHQAGSPGIDTEPALNHDFFWAQDPCNLPPLWPVSNAVQPPLPIPDVKIDIWQAVRHCTLFRLPLEVRSLIYDYVLVSPDAIEDPAGLLDDVNSLMLDERAKLHSIDAAITRSCRLINDETTRILYGRNVFVFGDVHKLQHFGEYHMLEANSKLFGSSQRQIQDSDGWPNRLALLRCITIRFKLESIFSRTNDRRRGRDASWRLWKRFFQREAYMADHKFKSLEKLVLDFSDWALSVDEGLVVQPIIAKLSESSRLQHLVVIGVQHEKTLQRLREGLIRGDGTFVVKNSG